LKRNQEKQTVKGESIQGDLPRGTDFPPVTTKGFQGGVGLGGDQTAWPQHVGTGLVRCWKQGKKKRIDASVYQSVKD